MASTSASDDVTLVPVKETDYLDEDKPIRGQNFVCLSFLSPEDVLINKEVWFFNRYINSFSKDVKVLLAGLRSKYPNDSDMFDMLEENNSHFFSAKELQDQFRFFKGNDGVELETEFFKEQNYRPTIRGIKVRGVFDTLKEAQTRAEVLKRMGDKFDIFVAQVGTWCPWSPNPDQLADQEYAETGLNTLMKKYKDNMDARDIDYEARKNDKIAKIAKNNEAIKKQNEEEAEIAAAAEKLENTTVSDIV